jgi:hypothetical protein
MGFGRKGDPRVAVEISRLGPTTGLSDLSALRGIQISVKSKSQSQPRPRGSFSLEGQFGRLQRPYRIIA